MYYTQQAKPLYGAFGQATVAVLPTRANVMVIQRWINNRAFGPGSGRTPIAEDGIWGRQTEWGFGLAGGANAMAARNAYLVRVGGKLPSPPSRPPPPPTAGFGAMRRRYVRRLRPGMVW